MENKSRYMRTAVMRTHPHIYRGYSNTPLKKTRHGIPINFMCANDITYTTSATLKDTAGNTDRLSEFIRNIVVSKQLSTDYEKELDVVELYYRYRKNRDDIEISPSTVGVLVKFVTEGTLTEDMQNYSSNRLESIYALARAFDIRLLERNMVARWPRLAETDANE